MGLLLWRWQLQFDILSIKEYDDDDDDDDAMLTRCKKLHVARVERNL